MALGSDVPDQLSLEELRQQIRSLRGSGYDTTRLRVGYFGKPAQPFTPLVMLLLGVPFAFRVGRSGSLYAIGVSLILVIVYWETLAIFRAMGLETILRELEGPKRRFARDPDLYYVTLFGTPSNELPWGWRIEAGGWFGFMRHVSAWEIDRYLKVY